MYGKIDVKCFLLRFSLPIRVMVPHFAFGDGFFPVSLRILSVMIWHFGYTKCVVMCVGIFRPWNHLATFFPHLLFFFESAFSESFSSIYPQYFLLMHTICYSPARKWRKTIKRLKIDMFRIEKAKKNATNKLISNTLDCLIASIANDRN